MAEESSATNMGFRDLTNSPWEEDEVYTVIDNPQSADEDELGYNYYYSKYVYDDLNDGAFKEIEKKKPWDNQVILSSKGDPIIIGYTQKLDSNGNIQLDENEKEIWQWELIPDDSKAEDKYSVKIKFDWHYKIENNFISVKPAIYRWNRYGSTGGTIRDGWIYECLSYDKDYKDSEIDHAYPRFAVNPDSNKDTWGDIDSAATGKVDAANEWMLVDRWYQRNYAMDCGKIYNNSHVTLSNNEAGNLKKISIIVLYFSWERMKAMLHGTNDTVDTINCNIAVGFKVPATPDGYFDYRVKDTKSFEGTLPTQDWYFSGAYYTPRGEIFSRQGYMLKGWELWSPGLSEYLPAAATRRCIQLNRLYNSTWSSRTCVNIINSIREFSGIHENSTTFYFQKMTDEEIKKQYGLNKSDSKEYYDGDPLKKDWTLHEHVMIPIKTSDGGNNLNRMQIPPKLVNIFSEQTINGKTFDPVNEVTFYAVFAPKLTKIVFGYDKDKSSFCYGLYGGGTTDGRTVGENIRLSFYPFAETKKLFGKIEEEKAEVLLYQFVIDNLRTKKGEQVLLSKVNYFSEGEEEKYDYTYFQTALSEDEFLTSEEKGKGYILDGFSYGDTKQKVVSRKKSSSGKITYVWAVDDFFFDVHGVVNLDPIKIATASPDFQLENAYLDSNKELTVDIEVSTNTEEEWRELKYTIASNARPQVKEVEDEEIAKTQVSTFNTLNKLYFVGYKIGKTKATIYVPASGDYAEQTVIFNINVVKKKPTFETDSPWTIIWPDNKVEEDNSAAKVFSYSTNVDATVSFESAFTAEIEQTDDDGNYDGSIRDNLGQYIEINSDTKEKTVEIKWKEPSSEGLKGTLDVQVEETAKTVAAYFEQPLILKYKSYNVIYKNSRRDRNSVVETKQYDTAYTLKTPSTLPENNIIDKEKTGYMFVGWYDYNDLDENNNPRLYQEVDGVPPYLPSDMNRDVTLCAYWEKLENTITFNSAGGFDTPTPVKKKRNEVYMINFENVPQRLGYTFLGWGIDPYNNEVTYPYGETSNYEYSKNEDITLYAKWENKSDDNLNKLYPPIVNTYQRSQLISSSMRIEYQMPIYNLDKVEKIKSIHVSLTNQVSNKSVLTATGTEDEIQIFVVPWESSTYEFNEELNTGIGYIEIPIANVMDKRFKYQLYKAQLRFDITELTDEEFDQLQSSQTLNNYLVSNKDNFSDWSAATLIKPIIQNQIDWDIQQEVGPRINCNLHGSLIFNTQNYEDENVEISEYIETYSLNIYTTDGVLVYSTGEKKPKEKNIIDENFDFSKSNVRGKDVKIEYSYTLNDGFYFSSISDTIKVNSFSDIATSPILEIQQDDEYGINYINCSLGGWLYGTYSADLFRSSSKDNYNTWQKLRTFNNVSNNAVSEIIEDNLIESGIGYRYCLQKYTNEKDGSKPIETVQVANPFYYATLLRQDKMLKLSFNFKINNYTVKVGRTITETIGGRYPIFTKNANLKYKQIGISGRISFEDNLDEKFITIEELLGEKYCSSILSQLNSGHNHVDKLNYYILPNDYQWLVERKFRDEVYDWLNDGQPKLLRNGTEGNLIVLLTDIALTPDATLGRKLYDFSATAYEIENAEEKTNLEELGIIQGE